MWKFLNKTLSNYNDSEKLKVLIMQSGLFQNNVPYNYCWITVYIILVLKPPRVF